MQILIIMNNNYLSEPSNHPPVGGGAGVILIHEFWGVNEQIKKTADKISAEGYLVLAVDLYNGKIAQNVDEAKKMKDEVTDEHALEQIRRAILELEKNGVPANKIAVWGFCFGGSIAFKSAVENLGAGAYVIYYGSMITEQKEILEKIQKPVLGIFGGQDQGIPTTKVESMKKMLDLLGKKNETYIYPNAGHAFANETRESYNPADAKDAWEKTMAFLTKYLKGVQ